MFALLNRIALFEIWQWVESALTVFLFGFSFVWAYLFSEDPSNVFESIDGAITYLSIISSVSFAVLALLAQLFEKKSVVSEMSHIHLVGTYKAHIKVEGARMIFMIIPILLSSFLSVADLNESRIAAVLLLGFTIFALSISVMLPFKYAFLMKGFISTLFDDAEKSRIEKNKELARKIKGE